MDALRCPPPDAQVETLSGGERRRRGVMSAPDTRAGHLTA